MDIKLSVVVPVYNEEKSIEIFLERLIKTLSKIKSNYEIIFVLDPSTDETEKIILNELKKN